MSKKIQLLVPLLLFLTLIPMFFYALYQDKEEIPSPLIGAAVPEFVLQNLEGDQVFDQSLFNGEPKLLNVWASWCPSCVVEHPFLTHLSENGVQIIGLNYKDKREDAQHFLNQLGNPFSVVLFDEKGELGMDLGVYGAPETYLIDGEGRIVLKRVGVLDEHFWKLQFEKKWLDLKTDSTVGEEK